MGPTGYEVGAWRQLSCPGLAVLQSVRWAPGKGKLLIHLWSRQPSCSRVLAAIPIQCGLGPWGYRKGRCLAHFPTAGQGTASQVAGGGKTWYLMGSLCLSHGVRPPGAHENLCSESIHLPEGTWPNLANANTTTSWETDHGRKKKKLHILVPLMALFPVFLNKGLHISNFLGLHKLCSLSCLQGLLSSVEGF